MNYTDSLDDMKLLASLTFKDKLAQTFGLFKKHGRIIIFANFILIVGFYVVTIGASVALMPLDQVVLFLQGYPEDIPSFMVVNALLYFFIMLICGFLFSIPTVGFCSLILAYTRGDDPAPANCI